MVSPSSRRRAVKHIVGEGLGSAAQACRAIGLARSSLYRASQASEERRKMQSRIIDLSEQNPRYGYRRVTALLRREGAKINTKRVQRVRRQESLQVRKKQRRTKRLGMSTAMRQRAERANQIWSWDFVHDQSQEGTPFRILTLIDEHTKQCLATHVGWSVRAVDVITVIEASIQGSVSFSVCGSIFGFAVYTKESCSNDVSGSRRDRLQKTVGSSRARCEQRVALFKSLETTLDFSHGLRGGLSREKSFTESDGKLGCRLLPGDRGIFPLFGNVT